MADREVKFQNFLSQEGPSEPSNVLRFSCRQTDRQTDIQEGGGIGLRSMVAEAGPTSPALGAPFKPHRYDPLHSARITPKQIDECWDWTCPARFCRERRPDSWWFFRKTYKHAGVLGAPGPPRGSLTR